MELYSVSLQKNVATEFQVSSFIALQDKDYVAA